MLGWEMYTSKYKLVLDINCQNFGNIIQLKLYIKGFGNIHIFHIHIGYKLPTLGEYISVEFIYWYWIYPANN